MKKLLSLTLPLLLLFGVVLALSACGNTGDGDDDDDRAPLDGKSPKELYAAAFRAIENADSYILESEQQTLTTEGQRIFFSDVRMLDGENVYWKTESDSAKISESEMWYVDGVVYHSTGTNKYKATLTHGDFVEMYGDFSLSLLDLPSEFLEDAEILEKDGERYLEFILSGEEYKEFAPYGDLTDDTIYEDGIVYRVYFNEDGDLTKIYTSLQGTISGLPCASEGTVRITFEDVTVTPPEDPDSYTDTSY